MAAVDYVAGSFVGDEASPSRAYAPSRPVALDLARRLHDTVVQRLASLSVVLGSESGLSDGDRSRCRDEVLTALDELRMCLEDTIGGEGALAVAATFEDERRALVLEHPDAVLDCSPAEGLLGDGADPLIWSVLAEGLRNARKHAFPSQVLLEVAYDAETVIVVLRNDGVVSPAKRGCGMGLRLLGVEASLSGALVESRPDERGGWWQLSLILPARS